MNRLQNPFFKNLVSNPGFLTSHYGYFFVAGGGVVGVGEWLFCGLQDV